MMTELEKVRSFYRDIKLLEHIFEKYYGKCMIQRSTYSLDTALSSEDNFKKHVEKVAGCFNHIGKLKSVISYSNIYGHAKTLLDTGNVMLIETISNKYDNFDAMLCDLYESIIK